MNGFRMILLLILCGFLPVAANAQSVEAQLGGSTASETFSIINADGDTVVVFRGDGKAGLGITDPQADLDVSGTISADSLTGDGSRITGVATEAESPLVISNGRVSLTAAAGSGNLITFDGDNWIAADLVTGYTGSSYPVNNMQPYLVLNYCIALQGIFPSRNGSEPFIGEIMLVGFNFPPRAWAFCDGQIMAINQNQALYALLGTTYGGSGVTTFCLPDLRGRVPMHAGQGPGLSPRSWGQMSGTETNTLNTNNLPYHRHTLEVQ